VEKNFKYLSESLFKEKKYISNGEKVKINNVDHVKIEFHAQLDIDVYKSIENFKKCFFDFNEWEDLNPRNGEILVSKKLSSIIFEDKELTRHYFDFSIYGTPMLLPLTVRELTYYWEEMPIEGADYTFLFKSDRYNFHSITGGINFYGTKGWENKYGEIHIKENKIEKKVQIYVLMYIELKKNIHSFLTVISNIKDFKAYCFGEILDKLSSE
jgi:hypothetical protein